MQPRNRSQALDMAGVKLNLETLRTRAAARPDLCDFAEILAGNLGDLLVPYGFIIAAMQAIGKVRRRPDNAPALRGKTHDELVALVPDLAMMTCPPDFAAAVREGLRPKPQRPVKKGRMTM